MIDPLNPLVGTVIIFVVHLPFMFEVHLQMRISSRLYEELPPGSRAQFPDAPASPSRVILGSARFHRAFWAYVKREDVNDSPLQRSLKLALRRSMKRKVIVATLAFLVACALVVAGWRPYPTQEPASSLLPSAGGPS